MKTVRHHLIAQLRRGLQGHFGRVWEGFERLLIRNKDLLFRTSGNSRSLFLRFLALVEVFGDLSPQNRIQHVELL